ncbi:hypothetical protein Vafri_10309 [Volvox africanus]|uniref:Nuclear condensin complex subunit 3 C-terminal domain-containing protein n=1 Tax=Volvox africanus TaxID=51714 RepID=A0A8J4EZH6_9CHLO|nr:hypothetical protein Vafri_10309 [Volvox africanus]
MAAANVIDFFVRLSDGWIFDASHLKKLWAALRKDKDAACSQLAKCLLVYIGAPEKHESDKSIPRCMKEWAGLMPMDPVSKSWGEDVIGMLLAQLAEWMPQAAKHSRVRVLNLIVSILRGLRQETSLDEGIRMSIVGILLEHLPDKDDKVRQLVVIALTKLGFPEEVEDGSSDLTATAKLLAELTDALHSDISQDVRVELVNRLPLDKPTLIEVLRHRSDRSANVAAAVYDKVARDVPMLRPTTPGGVSASPEQRTSLLWYGLQEPRAEPRSAAQGLLAKWFVGDAAKDIVVLLEAFDPQSNTELCRLIVDQLVANEHWDPQSWLKAETAAGRSLPDLARVAEQFEGQRQRQQQAQAQSGAAGSGGASWLAGVSSALVFVWVYACRKVEEVALDKGRAAAERVAATVAQAEASAAAQAEAVLEAFLPTAQQMAKLCSQAAEAGPTYRYITAQLLELTTLSYMNWVDASSRQEAEATLWGLITETSRSNEKGGPSGLSTSRSPFLPVASGGSGAWEAAVLGFATALYSNDGAALVHGVLPMVLQLVEAGMPSALSGERMEEAPEGPLLQALTFLHLLMATAGPGVHPSTSTAPVQPALQQHEGPAATSTGTSSAGARSSWTLAQAVDSLAWSASVNPSPSVRAAAVRCYVELCLRDGGLEHVPRAIAMLAPKLSSAAAACGGSAYGAVATDDDLEFAAQQQLPRRVALQGLVDLALTWGEPTVTAELKKAVTAAASCRQVDDVTAQLEALGMDPDKAAARSVDAGAAAAAAGSPHVAGGVVPILMRLTEGAVRKFQGFDGYVPARGMAADALLGAARLVHCWSLQRRLNKRLRHQAVTTMQPRLAEQLLTRLLLARFSPSLESEPGLRSQISAFFKSFQEAASEAGEEGAVYRRMLAGSFLHAARCAMALPAPAGAPATARGCVAPALMEFAGELLASAAAVAGGPAAVSAAVSDSDDAEVSHANREAPAASTVSDAATAAAGPGAAADRGSDVGDGPPDAVVWLCEMVLEEVVRLSSPGRSSLDTSEGRVRAYAAELFKTPMRLLPGLPVINAATSPAVLTTIRWLAYLGRRAMLKASGGNLVKTVVPDTAYKKLQEFVRMLESLQQVKTAPISEEDAKVFLQAFREQHREKLEQLPSFEDVTADLAPDDEWDVLLAVDTSQGGVGARTAGGRADQARAKKRGPGTKGAKCGATKSHGSTMTTTMATRTRQTGKAAASRGTTSSRRADACDTTDTDDGFDADQGCGGAGMDMNTDIESDDDVFRRENTAAATKGTRNRAGGAAATATATARPAASQDTSAASYVGTQPERRSSRAAAAKASEKLEALRLN